jgi:hypothetical protein
MKSLVISKDSTCILDSFTFYDRAHPGLRPLACTVIARPAYFVSLFCRLYVYNQHTQQFSRSWFGDSHVTHTPTRTVRNVRCRIVYERSQQKRPSNNESGLATHPKGLRWSSYIPGVVEQSLKPAHVDFLKNGIFRYPRSSIFLF